MTVLVAHAAATWFMVGLIWVVQAVHYPLFASVGDEAFPAYEAGHARRIGVLLVVPASTELATAAALVWLRPDGVPLWLVVAGGALLAFVWVTTALVQAPLHGELSAAPDRDAMARLTASNWWRTAGWTLRGIGVAAMVLLAAT